jgi:hypothetical protein
MLDRILFNPENRLLGSSTGDLSLYGGQVDPTLAIREAGDGGLPVEARDGDASGDISPATSSPAGDVASAVPAGTLSEATGNAGAGSTIPHLIASPLALSPGVSPVQFESGAAPIVTAWQPGVPLPTGAGSLTPALANAAAAPPDQASAAPTDTLIHTAPAGAAMLAAAALAPVAAVAPALGDLTTAPVLLATNLIEATLTHVENVAAEAGQLVGNLVTTPLFTPPPLLDDLGDITSSVLGAVPPLVEGLSDVAGGPINATTDLLSATVSGATDTLDDLAGADPAAGVATLVSLVSVADMFDLNPVGAPTIEDAADPGLALLDTLAADGLLPDALLGGHHEDLGGLLDHGTPDLDHLPGL